MSYNLTGSSGSSTYGRLGTSSSLEHLTYTMMALVTYLVLGVGNIIFSWTSRISRKSRTNLVLKGIQLHIMENWDNSMLYYPLELVTYNGKFISLYFTKLYPTWSTIYNSRYHTYCLVCC
jgi:hypothetical protein